MPTAQRDLAELIDRDEPGMDLIRGWREEGSQEVAVLPAALADGERALLALQVTTRSPLGAIAYETGGILIDHGWLRILGAGSSRIPRSVVEWNRIDGPREEQRLPGACLVADDAVGGFFAINGGGLPGARGHVFYLAPDTCEWEDLEVGHTDWIHWALTGEVKLFYETMRWPGWEKESAELAGDQCIAFYPFLWTEGEPIEKRSRKPVSVDEIWRLHAIEFPKQLG